MKDFKNLYKTNLCREWKESGTCSHGKRCSFAHGEEELRGENTSSHRPNAPDHSWNNPKTIQHADVNAPPKYCKFWPKGRCNFGAECIFWHGDPHAYREKYGIDPDAGNEVERERFDHQPPLFTQDPYPVRQTTNPGPRPYVNLKKTKLCSWFQDGKCGNGAKCDFAHGEHELVAVPRASTAPYHPQSNDYPSAGGRPGDWNCRCGNICFASRTECLRCGSPKPNGEAVGGYGSKRSPPALSIPRSIPPPPPPQHYNGSSNSPSMTVDTRTPQGTDDEAWRMVVRAIEANDGKGLRGALQAILKTHSLVEKASIAHKKKLPSSNAFAAAFGPNDEEEENEGEQALPLNKSLPKPILTACINLICISLANLSLLNILLEFWSKPNHGCWTLLLSAGPVASRRALSDESSGHYCVLLHDLVRRSTPVSLLLPSSSASSSNHLSAASIAEMVGLVVKTRPSSLLDHDQEGNIPLYVALKHKAPHIVAVSVAPLTHIQDHSSSAKSLQEDVLMVAMESETKWDLPPKYLTDLILRDLMGQIEKSYEIEQRMSVESRYEELLREQREATRIPDSSTIKKSSPQVQAIPLNHTSQALPEQPITSPTPSLSSPVLLKPSGGSGGVPFAVPFAIPLEGQTRQPTAVPLMFMKPAPYNPFKRA